MIQHVKRLGLVVGLSMFSLWACAPASAQPAQADAGTPTADAGSPAADAGTGKKDTAAKPEAKAEGDAKGGRCTGKATFCAVYSQTFCSSQPGCSRSFSTSTCTGLAPKCETATNEAFCKKVKGCKWQ